MFSKIIKANIGLNAACTTDIRKTVGKRKYLVTNFTETSYNFFYKLDYFLKVVLQYLLWL